MRTFLATLAVLPLISSASPTHHAPVVHEIASFATGAWVENIAVRANGALLVTRLDKPELWSIDPATKHMKIVATIPGVTALSGVTETAPDVFAVAAGNFSFVDGAIVTDKNSYSLWTVDFRSRRDEPHVKKAVSVPQATMINGLVSLDAAAGTVLGSDSLQGVVHRINLHTGASAVVLSDPVLALPPPPGFPFAVNGIQKRGSNLYFTNFGQNLFGRVPIRKDGTAAGEFQTITTVEFPDDFALAPNGDAYVTDKQLSSVERVAVDGSRSTVVAGADFAGINAVQFGRGRHDRHVLYVVTAGGRDEKENALSPAKVLAVVL